MAHLLQMFVQGNCTTPPSLNALGASDSVDLIPGQCMVVVGSLANYKFSGDLWIDGIYFKQTHQNQPRPLGGGMYIPKNAWITSCTLDWSSQGDDGCPDCPEWLDGGIFVDGGLYVKGVTLSLSTPGSYADLGVPQCSLPVPDLRCSWIAIRSENIDTFTILS